MKWIKPKEYDNALVYEKISPLLSHILFNRGILPAESASFLNPLLEKFDNPMLLPDMEKAVQRIIAARDNEEHICIYGDYDADGLDSQAILKTALDMWGFKKVSLYTPHRHHEGYGLNNRSITQLAGEGVNLLIALDLGTSNVNEVDHANSLGMNVIIVDHHHVPLVVPRAYAFINPNMSTNKYGYSDFAAAGVTFKLVRALSSVLGIPDPDMIHTLRSLVTIGTVADIVPLTGENRLLVTSGLQALRTAGHVGVKALASIAGIEQEDISTGAIGFALGPRINAAGRLYHPEIVRYILLPDDAIQAYFASLMLSRINRERQGITKSILEEANAYIAEKYPIIPRVLFVKMEHGTSGTAGLVAGRIAEKYHRPTLAYRCTDESLCAGSARSIGSFSIIDALERAGGILERFGGHVAAAGFSVREEKMKEFETIIQQYAEEQDISLFEQTLSIDATIPHEMVNEETITDFSQMEPFGKGNEEPLFRINNVRFIETKAVGGDKSHMRVKVLLNNGRIISSMAFGKADLRWTINPEKEYDIAAILEINRWKGEENFALQIKDFRPSNFIEENE